MAEQILADGEPLLTCNEVAALLGVRPGAVNEWRRSGRIPDEAVVVADGVFRYVAPVIRALRDERGVKP